MGQLQEQILATLAQHQGALCIAALHAALLANGKPTLAKVRASLLRLERVGAIVVTHRRAYADIGALVEIAPGCQAELAGDSAGRAGLARAQAP